MIFIGHAQGRETPRVFHVGVEREAIVFDRQRSAVAKDFDRAGEVIAEDFFETFPPARSARRKSAKGKADRRHVEARVEAAAAVEANFIGIEFVKIVEDTADGKTFVVVEGMLENTDGKRAAVKHQVLADDSAAVGEAVRKLLVGGEQQEARRFRAIRADNDGFRFLALDVALRIEINSAGGAAVSMDLDAMDVGVRADFA